MRQRIVFIALGALLLSILLSSGPASVLAATPTTASILGLPTGTGPTPSISAGFSHTCVLQANGTIQCWGNNDNGQLGNGTTTASLTPVSVTGITTAIAVAAGDFHTCALLADGSVRCWGYNTFGQLGNNTTTDSPVPVPVSGALGGTLIDAVSIATGSAHSCAVLASSLIACWGDNQFGQLGFDTSPSTSSATPIFVGGSQSGYTSVDAGLHHTCASRSNGTARCWGANANGQLGNATLGVGGQSINPVAVSSLSNVTGITTGDRHNCARVATGEVFCWGGNAEGQLGTDTGGFSSSSASQVAGLTNATRVDAGGLHTCARLANGTASCWGYNTFGQLGNNTTTGGYTHVATQFALGEFPVVLSAGNRHTCALLANGAARCWGSNTGGELGTGTTNPALTPATTLLSPAIAVTAIDAGDNHTCALISTGVVKCWGDNSDLQLGVATPANTATPQNPGGSAAPAQNVIGLSVGSDHTCVLFANGTAKCWGDNELGQLGDNTTTDKSSQTITVVGLEFAVALSAGANHTCALLADGGVQCWGYDANGELGNNSDPASLIPVDVALSTGEFARAISAGAGTSCAVLSDGTARCWGSNANGATGNASGSPSFQSPVTVSTLTSAVQISVGGSRNELPYVCALRANGTIACWGTGNYGQLGNNDTLVSNHAPVEVVATNSFRQVATGGAHTCATLPSGGVQCWGVNSNFQSGIDDSNVLLTAIPTDVTFSDATLRLTAVTAGRLHSCALTAQGQVYCWGSNEFGQGARPSTDSTGIPTFAQNIVSYVFLPLLRR